MCVCAHSASGHGIGCQAVRTPYIYTCIYNDKHTSAQEEHLTYLKEGRFAHQLLTLHYFYLFST